MPHNKGMELTVKSDTLFARRRARPRRFCLLLIPGVMPLMCSSLISWDDI